MSHGAGEVLQFVSLRAALTIDAVPLTRRVEAALVASSWLASARIGLRAR